MPTVARWRERERRRWRTATAASREGLEMREWKVEESGVED